MYFEWGIWLEQNEPLSAMSFSFMLEVRLWSQGQRGSLEVGILENTEKTSWGVHLKEEKIQAFEEMKCAYILGKGTELHI